MVAKLNTEMLGCKNKIQTKFVANIKYRNLGFQKQNRNKVAKRKYKKSFSQI